MSGSVQSKEGPRQKFRSGGEDAAGVGRGVFGWGAGVGVDDDSAVGRKTCELTEDEFDSFQQQRRRKKRFRLDDIRHISGKMEETSFIQTNVLGYNSSSLCEWMRIKKTTYCQHVVFAFKDDFFFFGKML